MELKTRQIGRAYEDRSTTLLIKQGHEIIERNFSNYLGEIDIISEKNNNLYFFECKHNKNICITKEFCYLTYKSFEYIITSEKRIDMKKVYVGLIYGDKIKIAPIQRYFTDKSPYLIYLEGLRYETRKWKVSKEKELEAFKNKFA